MGKRHFKYSSSYREFCNLVEPVEDAARDDQLEKSDLFSTDKYVTKSAYYRNTSRSKILFQLVLRLQEIEMERTLRIQVIHVTGMRKISQGTNGLSRVRMIEDAM